MKAYRVYFKDISYLVRDAMSFDDAEKLAILNLDTNPWDSAEEEQENLKKSTRKAFKIEIVELDNDA